MSQPAPPPVIRLRGVRHNNLKGFDLDLPQNRLIVITGLSGSGKSSLAFDTLFAEGQRRYIETFSPYARQFFDRMDKPRVDSIEGIPPAIAIEQRNAVRTTRSTVGTMTEICDYLKVLWPHLAQLHCRGCGRPVRKDTPQQIWLELSEEVGSQKAEVGRESAECLVTFDLPLSEKLTLAEELALITKQGYQRLLVGGDVVRLDEIRSPKSEIREMLTVVQDRLRLTAPNRARFVEACEQAYHFGKGRLAVHKLEPQGPAASRFTISESRRFSNRLHCAECDLEYREPTPALFSFNHPVGACPACKGFGRIISIDYDLALPDRSLSLAEGAVRPWRSGFSAECQDDLTKFCRARKVPMHVPFRELSAEHQRWVIEGDADYGSDEEHQWPRAWYGIKGYFRWLESKAYKMHVRVLLSRYRAYTSCPECRGQRLKPEALLWRLRVENGGSKMADAPRSSTLHPPPSLTLAEFYALPIRDSFALVEALWRERASRGRATTANDPVALALGEVHARLSYLAEVGLGYLTLDRPTRTLSGGETERVNLTTCLGSRLVNTLFVLDEPSVGLHARDTARLIRILERLRDAGNSVVVVEHEASVMRAADQIVDLGPGHGETGGEVVFQGTFAALQSCAASLTGQYLSGRKQIEIPPRRPVGNPKCEVRSPKIEAAPRATSLQASDFGSPSDFESRSSNLPWLRLRHAARHNLQDLSLAIPLSRFVCVTGVSGSGKSTLIREVLFPALQANLKSELSGPTAAKASDRLDTEPDDSSRAGDDDNGSTSVVGYPTLILAGWEELARVVMVDQAPLGKTPRSNPAVYIGAFDDIRELFAASEAARQRGLNASAFSFNSAQGQCERCRGAGFEKIEMQFLSDVFIRCPDCDGRRYREHILEVRIQKAEVGRQEPEVRSQKVGGKGREAGPKSEIRNPSPVASWSIADVLDASVDEVLGWLDGFGDSRYARRATEKLKLLQEVGLGYLRLGQPINTLSGGESQRLKLAAHLAAVAANVSSPLNSSPGGPPSQPRSDERSHSLFLFDEPTTGLHFDDVRVLLQVFQRLVDAGHSVIVIEHNLEVIKCADWVIDLGPEAGDEGGQVVAAGTPEQIAGCDASHTGRALRELGLATTPI